MAKTRPGVRAILAPAERRDIKEILFWSEAKFGKAPPCGIRRYLSRRCAIFKPIQRGLASLNAPIFRRTFVCILSPSVVVEAPGRQ